MGNNDYQITDLDTHKNEITEELKNAECSDLEDMFFILELTCSEIAEIFDTKFIAISSTGNTQPKGNGI